MDAAITRATRAINQALSQLEKETGQVVDSIQLSSVDVTRLDSTRQMLSRSVRIELKPLPGSQWEGI